MVNFSELAIIGGLAAALTLSKGNFLQQKLEPNVQPTLVTPLVQVDPVLQESLDDQLAKNALLQNQLNESLSTEFQLNQIEQQFGKLYTQTGTTRQLTADSRAALQKEADEFNRKYRTYANTGRKNPSQVGVGWAIQYADKYGFTPLIQYENVPKFEAL